MAKDRTAKAEAKQKVPKVVDDKVKKAKKEKKPKAVAKEESEDSDSSAASDAQQEQSGKKVKESSSDSSSDSASEASDDSSSDSDEAEAPTKPKKAPVEVEPNSIFTIDTKPTKAAPKDEVALKEDGIIDESGKINRRTRRRLQLIGKQREALRKSMNLGADDNSAELEAALDKWIKQTDGKAAVRDKKKQDRKEKEASRLRTRKGKLLKGRKLKERQKVVSKLERREKKLAQEQEQTES
ncbi:hypothetical protein BKA67DRAFT_657262 [Truncatella angustata]|uniref:Uncharacterized protein n=1 Tax=Truncatella angustata TaxID=152316 RepID=A0A9P8ZZS5_9PEZI|nr:uncharacterized protein BKA67DRAFT_657262 [Truncatella angustata]KAH6655314.1 hypothetical protein BKA67DRAFT_657262 [Truncatella angustata]